jgi:putative flavoprotein involved in K+ transport
MTTNTNTVIVGGGQAGLSVSYYLTRQGRDHVVLEQADRAAPVWRDQRWDSFTLVLPNWTIRLPGGEYQGDDPDGFMTREQFATYIEQYAQRVNPPIRYGMRVTSVEAENGGYLVKTGGETFRASNVVMATGCFQQPKVPPFSANLHPDIVQLPTSAYRNSQQLPPGAVLVVGSGQSGSQIAEELYQSGRRVYLSVGSAGRFPRRYRGKDTAWWAQASGFFDRTVDKLPSPKARFAGNPVVTGKDGGHTLNLHQFARDGVVLLGHVQGVQDGHIGLAPDLKETLAKVDKFEADIVKMADDFIAKAKLDAPQETLPQLRDGYDVDVITELDLKAAGITSVIWAMGYKFDYSLVKPPVLDEDGYPRQVRGRTEHPGLYFVGMMWLYTLKSGNLLGVGEDAAFVASDIADRERRR